MMLMNVFFSSLCGDPVPNWETIHNRKREEYVNINNNQKPKPKPKPKPRA